ncbi:MAG TPA: helix-turn-helix domain-containing protein [Roseiflexaceae bacterium]|jgi:AcrR family transcriptional regulator|nr:helix-turn-helix domain-containing protein [Roseiflexaceae bacterium]
MMNTIIPHQDARERVLAAAEQLFARRGYAAVTLRDIAAAVGIRHASLYHHAPGGKEQLYIEVAERNFQRHRAGLTSAIQRAEPNVRAQLRAAAGWLLSQPPMDLVRLTHSDLPLIAPAEAERLSRMAYDAMLSPIQQALEAARQRGEIAHPQPGLIAGGILGMVESLHAVPDMAITESRTAMAHALLDALLQGLYARS